MYDDIYLADVMEISPTPTSAKSVPTCRAALVVVVLVFLAFCLHFDYFVLWTRILPLKLALPSSGNFGENFENAAKIPFLSFVQINAVMIVSCKYYKTQTYLFHECTVQNISEFLVKTRHFCIR